jgi:Tol biopolymer transport system component
MSQPEFIEEVKRSIEHIISDTVQEESYVHAKGSKWTEKINEEVLTKLTAASQSYKYIVSTSILQKSRDGSYSSYACHWDTSKDVSFVVPWNQNDVNVIVTVFVISI